MKIEPDGAEFVFRAVELKDGGRLDAMNVEKVRRILKERFSTTPNQSELRHHENLLKPGTEIYVLGTVETTPLGGHVNRAGKGRLIISPESESAVAEHYKGESSTTLGYIIVLLTTIAALCAWVFS